jgi:hypothetical protein
MALPLPTAGPDLAHARHAFALGLGACKKAMTNAPLQPVRRPAMWFGPQATPGMNKASVESRLTTGDKANLKSLAHYSTVDSVNYRCPLTRMSPSSVSTTSCNANHRKICGPTTQLCSVSTCWPNKFNNIAYNRLYNVNMLHIIN